MILDDNFSLIHFKYCYFNSYDNTVITSRFQWISQKNEIIVFNLLFKKVYQLYGGVNSIRRFFKTY